MHLLQQIIGACVNKRVDQEFTRGVAPVSVVKYRVTIVHAFSNISDSIEDYDNREEAIVKLKYIHKTSGSQLALYEHPTGGGIVYNKSSSTYKEPFKVFIKVVSCRNVATVEVGAPKPGAV